jgi:hypothetical protein
VNIILVAGATAKARTITLDWRHWAGGGAALFFLFISFTFAFNFLTLKWAAATKHPLLATLVLADQREESARVQERVQGHLNAMAVRLGELQAQMLRLENVGERLARNAGLNPKELPTMAGLPGRGGAPSSLPSRDLSIGEFAALVDGLGRQMDLRSDQFSGPRGAARARLGQPKIPAYAVPDPRRLVFVELRLPHRPFHRAAVDA